MPDPTIRLKYEIDTNRCMFTLMHKGELMVNTDPDTGAHTLLTLEEAIHELKMVEFAWEEAEMDFIKADWDIVTVLPLTNPEGGGS